MERSVMEVLPVEMPWLLHAGAQSTYGHLHKSSPRLRMLKF